MTDVIDERAATTEVFVPSVDVAIRYWDAYATSQLSSTESIVLAVPRSTCHHWPSKKSELHRVVESPSTAFSGPSEAFSMDEAVVARPSARSPGGGPDAGPSTRASQNELPNCVARTTPVTRT